MMVVLTVMARVFWPGLVWPGLVACLCQFINLNFPFPVLLLTSRFSTKNIINKSDNYHENANFMFLELASPTNGDKISHSVRPTVCLSVCGTTVDP